MKVSLLYEEGGSYDEYYVRVVSIYLDQAKAYAEAERLNKEAKYEQYFFTEEEEVIE